MTHILLVGLGGFIGSVARYKIGVWTLDLAAEKGFPIGTFIVNLLGCLIIGLLAGVAEKHDLFSQEVKLLLFTGLIGGFTTFSAFGLETVSLLSRGEVLVAIIYVSASVLLGVAAVWFGIRVI